MDIKNSDLLVESKTLRETVIERVEILDKVKKLSMLPDDLHITIEMAASYYEVEINIIQKTVSRNRQELEMDGLIVIRGKRLADFKSVSGITGRMPSLTLIPKRAMLRMGMLLQESKVAKEIRSMLLDKEEEARTTPDFSTLSPQLQFMIQMEQRHNALEAKTMHLEKQNNAIMIQNNELKQSMNHLSLVVDNELFVNDHQKAEIQNAVFKRIGKLTSLGYECHFQTLFRGLKLHFTVPKYDKIKRIDFERAIEFINGWFPKVKEGTN